MTKVPHRIVIRDGHLADANHCFVFSEQGLRAAGIGRDV
jgi:hypothetical protein